ncbi:MAG: DUF2029 domain-containing protein [Pseudomonadales bacterium]|nr:DUF2029 domain-containing protein [Pseudomonadales bacterium]
MSQFKASLLKLSPIKYLLFIATIVYFSLAVLTYHPDNKQVLFWASIDGTKLVDVWKVGTEKYPNISQFNYPPAHYLVDKLLYFIAKPIAGPGYDEWLSSPNDHDRFQLQITKFTLATKTGLIFLGIFSGYLVYLVVAQLNNKKQALIATSLWLFNPITLYSIPMMGQNDIIAICFFLMGWLSLRNNKFLATILFGISASIKMIPLIWVPFLLASNSRINWKQKFIIFSGSGLIYIATLIPFLNNENFQKSILTGNHSQRFLYSQISFGFSEGIYIIPILLMIILAGIFVHITKSSKKLSLPSFALMVVNMTMLSFTHFHPQWWIWVVLFWAMWMTTIDAKRIGGAIVLSFISFCCWLSIVVLFKDIALSFAMLLPLNSNLANLPTINSYLVARGTDVEQLVKLAYSWLAGISIISIGLFFKSQLPTIHKRIVISTYINKLLNKIFSNGVLRKTTIISLIGFLFVSFTLVSQIIPAPIASKPPNSIRYEPLTSNYEITFSPEFSNLERFDLYLSDKTLKGTGNYLIQTKIGEEEIFQQVIQGENIGFESIIRFDLPNPIDHHVDNYTVRIAPLEYLENGSNIIQENENTIMVGIINPENPYQSLAIRPYFSAPNIKSILPRTYISIKNIINQTLPLFVLIGLGIVIFG